MNMQIKILPCGWTAATQNPACWHDGSLVYWLACLLSDWPAGRLAGVREQNQCLRFTMLVQRTFNLCPKMRDLISSAAQTQIYL